MLHPHVDRALGRACLDADDNYTAECRSLFGYQYVLMSDLFDGLDYIEAHELLHKEIAQLSDKISRGEQWDVPDEQVDDLYIRRDFLYMLDKHL